VNRLGLKGAQEVKDHPWLKNFPWKDIYEKKIQPKFVPKVINL
jgi:serum/glucocorticoid-regulated kinase 2